MRPRSALWTSLFVAILLLAVLPAAALSKMHVTKQDRVATRAYLEAKLSYERAATASASVSKANVEALASRLAGECPDVAAGAPKLEDVLLGGRPGGPRSARQRGERGRRLRQWSDLETELSIVLDQARSAPYREAALTFANTVMRLRWSDGNVTAFEHAEAAAFEWILDAAPQQVCVDLRFWAASGYRSLSSATRTLGRELEQIEEPLWLAVFRQRSLSPNGFEDAGDRGLARRVEHAEEARLTADRALIAIETRLQSVLGLIGQEEAARHEARETPPKGSVVIGKGSTAAGGAYTIRAEPTRSRRSHAPHRHSGCVELEIEETGRGANGRWSSGSFDCISRSRYEAPTVTCDGGLLTVEARTPPSVRRVRLTLSDGREITSPVAIVPAKLGGQIGFYYQVLRGPSPIPVRLSELGARGKLLRSVRLPRRSGCKRPANRGYRFTEHVIVAGRVAQGRRFLIIGRRGPVFMGEGGRPTSGGGLEIEARVPEFGFFLFQAGEPLMLPNRPRPHARPFAFRVATGCQPHEYAILYGLLRDSRDSVLARSSTGLVPLRRVPMPASLHAHGVLAYAALPAAPSEVVVRTPAGRTVLTASLSRRAKQAHEVCEGEAEPPV
jgi:hypothetical protein